jgi:hypothetical protein
MLLGSGARLAVGLALGVLAAHPAAAGADRLLIQVTTVQATDSGECDPSLEPLRARLRKVAGYTSYRALADERRTVGWHSEEEFRLPGGRTLLLWPKSMQDHRVVLQVRLLDGTRRLVDTQVRLQNRGFMVFGLGRDGHIANGATLILVRAEN